MKKSEVVETMQTRIDKINRELRGEPTLEQIREVLTRCDEIRNIANLLGGLDIELN